MYRVKIVDDSLYQSIKELEPKHNYYSDTAAWLLKSPKIRKHIPKSYLRAMKTARKTSGGFAVVFLTKKYAYKFSFNDCLYPEFVDVCTKNQHNPHLPKIYDACVIEIKKDKKQSVSNYILTLVKMERLEQVKQNSLTDILVGCFSELEICKDYNEPHIAHPLFSLIKTASGVYRKLNRNDNIVIDASENNFMYRPSTGDFVITDIFYS